MRHLQTALCEPQANLMLARYYSSSLGRFMAVDPGDDTAAEDPQSWNKYAYVRNNPLAYLDPTGEESYFCVRPLTNEAASWIAGHEFVVHNATGLGQGGTVRSFGDDGTDHLGEVASVTTGFSEGTMFTDQAAWQSLGTSTPAPGVACNPITAPDATVAAVANGVMSGMVEYSAIPELQGGANSNGAAQAVANRASAAAGNGPVPEPGSLRTPGSTPAATNRVPFRCGTPGGATKGKAPASKVDQKVQAQKERAAQGPKKKG